MNCQTLVFHKDESENVKCIELNGVKYTVQKDETFYDMLKLTYHYKSDDFEQFLKNGTSPNITDNEGNTLLMRCCSMQYMHKFIELLLKYNANVNQSSADGWTALHVTSESDGAYAKLLISHGANVLAKTNDGKTPLDIAISWNYNNIELANYLKSLYNPPNLTEIIKSGDLQAVNNYFQNNVEEIKREHLNEAYHTNKDIFNFLIEKVGEMKLE